MRGMWDALDDLEKGIVLNDVRAFIAQVWARLLRLHSRWVLFHTSGCLRGTSFDRLCRPSLAATATK